MHGLSEAWFSRVVLVGINLRSRGSQAAPDGMWVLGRSVWCPHDSMGIKVSEDT